MNGARNTIRTEQTRQSLPSPKRTGSWHHSSSSSQNSCPSMANSARLSPAGNLRSHGPKSVRTSKMKLAKSVGCSINLKRTRLRTWYLIETMNVDNRSKTQQVLHPLKPNIQRKSTILILLSYSKRKESKSQSIHVMRQRQFHVL